VELRQVELGVNKRIDRVVGVREHRLVESRELLLADDGDRRSTLDTILGKVSVRALGGTPITEIV